LLAALVALVVSLRVFIADRWLKMPRRGSLIAFGIGMLAVLALRLFMPVLAE
jgi:hypothetical protein